MKIFYPNNRVKSLLTVFFLAILALITSTNSVSAYTDRRIIELDREFDESFETMLIRAEGAARAMTQRRFDDDLLITEVSIVIVGNNLGETVPMLSIVVNRKNWQNHPDPRKWGIYFPEAKKLLKF